MRTLPSALTWLAIAFFVALSGVIYNALFSEGPHSYVGATYALFCGIPLVAFERGLIAPRLHRRIQRLPTPAYVPAALVAEFALISLGFAGAGIGAVCANAGPTAIKVAIAAIAVRFIRSCPGKRRDGAGWQNREKLDGARGRRAQWPRFSR